MEEKILYKKIRLKECDNTLLEYYMIIEKIAEGLSALKSYGVSVSKTTYRPGGGKTVEMKQINGIFYRRADAEKFLECISKNTVTPVSLCDVTEDYITEILEKIIEEKRAAV